MKAKNKKCLQSNKIILIIQIHNSFPFFLFYSYFKETEQKNEMKKEEEILIQYNTNNKINKMKEDNNRIRLREQSKGEFIIPRGVI